MNFTYSARTKHGKKIYGEIDANNKKGAMIQLKKQKVIVIKIEEYKEKKGFKKYFQNLNKKQKNIKTFNTEKVVDKKEQNFLQNISKNIPFMKKIKETKIFKTEEKQNQKKQNEEELNKYTYNDLNIALQRSDMFNKIEYENSKETTIDLKEIDVDAIINSNFKDGLSTFKKEKEKKTNLLMADLDINTIKKILTVDIGGSKKNINGVKKKKSKKVKSKEILMFCKKLSTLLETGVPITRCLQILMEQTENGYFQKILAIITRDISQGIQLSQSMSKFPNVFNLHFTALVKTGEDTGELSKTFSLLYEEILNSEKIKSKVKGATMYPSVILGVLLVAFIVAAKILVPMFTDLFDGMGLPKFTEIVFGFLTFFDQNLLWIGLTIFLFVTLLKFSLRNITIRYKFDILKLKLPVVGVVLTEFHIINILRTIEISLKNGLPMTNALELAVQTTENIAFKFELQKILNKIVQGISLSTAMKESPLFPSLCIQMLKIGEESGRMEDLIGKTLEFYEWELNDFIDKTSKLIEPVAIIIVAIFVVCFVFAVAIPMFDLSSGAMLE